MRKPKVKQVKEVVIKYTIICPFCEKEGVKKEIKGNSVGQAEYAYGVHIKQKHKKEKK